MIPPPPVWKLMSQSENVRDFTALAPVPGREDANKKQLWSAAFGSDDDGLRMNTAEISKATGLTDNLIPRDSLLEGRSSRGRGKSYSSRDGGFFSPLLMEVAQHDASVASSLLKPAPLGGPEYDVGLLCETTDAVYQDLLENDIVGDLTEILVSRRKWSKSRRQKTGCVNTKWRRKAARRGGFCH